MDVGARANAVSTINVVVVCCSWTVANLQLDPEQDSPVSIVVVIACRNACEAIQEVGANSEALPSFIVGLLINNRGANVKVGTTKYGLVYLTRALALELKNTPVKMCFLSPGIVVTDLLVPPPDQRGERWEQSKKILNILADTVETVTPFLVEGMLQADKNGAAVRWLTRGKVRWRFFMSLFRKRDVFGPLGY